MTTHCSAWHLANAQEIVAEYTSPFLEGGCDISVTYSFWKERSTWKLAAGSEKMLSQPLPPAHPEEREQFVDLVTCPR